jgi:hypothetical protein
MDCEGIGAVSRDHLEDGISALGPHERLGVGIVGVNERGNVGLELFRVGDRSRNAIGTSLRLRQALDSAPVSSNL